MNRVSSWLRRQPEDFSLAIRALRSWGPRQISAALLAALAVGGITGLVTVLVPNPVFVRDVPTEPWNYPVWALMSILTGMLVATYVRPVGQPSADRRAVSSGRVGGAGAVLGWFAVGCPVCNKIAVLTLGYTGALTWFAPLQPVLALAAIGLSVFALVWRLRGQIACPAPTRTVAA